MRRGKPLSVEHGKVALKGAVPTGWVHQSALEVQREPPPPQASDIRSHRLAGASREGKGTQVRLKESTSWMVGSFRVRCSSLRPAADSQVNSS